MSEHPSGILIGKRFFIKENTMKYWHITDQRIKEELRLIEERELILV